MPGRVVYVVCADGEEELAEQLARPLRGAGYDVAHNGTIAVGESLVGEAQRALASSSPIVLCATARAAGSAWAHQVVNAAHSDGPVRVFVVQMEKQAFVKQLAMDGKVARYCDDPARAVNDLLSALGKHFPPLVEINERVVAEAHSAGRQILDQPTESTTFDTEALQRFRNELRKEVADRHPAVLSEWEFLHRTGLLISDRLTGTGALLFAKDPSVAFPAAMIKCARYFGDDRTAEREIETFEGTVPSQIVAARNFVADRVRIGESPSAHQAQATILYGYPMIAVREIIANALVHRDYAAADSCVHVRLFADRLEVSSPGSWLGRDLSADKDYDLANLAGHSVKRNFRLANVLSWARLVEGEGSGIPSAVRACHENHSPAPTVREEQGFVTVTLRRRPWPLGVATPVAQFEAALRELRARVGIPSKESLAYTVSDISGPAVMDRLNSNRIPTWPAVERLIRQLGGDEKRFHALWEAAAMTEPVLTEADPTSVASFLATYRRHVVDQFGKLEPPDFERRRRIPLADSYVSPTISPEDNHPGRTIDIWQFDNEIERSVLLGDPGGGKTTACHVLMHRHASDDQRRVPFLVTLRDFAAHDPPERSVASYIEHSLETFYQCPAPPGVVEHLLLIGSALVIFDGLDELLDTSRRADVSARIERFCAEYPLATVMVTSRLVGYDQARLDDSRFTRYRLGGFDHERVSEFVHKWFAYEEGILGPEADAFMEESASASDLRSNPLLLSLLCILYRGEGSLPQNRAEVYEQCTNLLFRRWDARRRIHQDLVAGHLMEPVLRHLAWWIFNRTEDWTPVTERELVRETAAFLQDRGFESDLDAMEAAVGFVEFCCGRMWVFSDMGTTASGERLYSFTHRTFLEYFTAAYLAYSSDTPEALALVLAPKITEQKWDTVGQLAVQIKDHTSVRGAERVIRAMLENESPPTAEGRAVILKFADKCASTGNLPTREMRRPAN